MAQASVEFHTVLIPVPAALWKEAIHFYTKGFGVEPRGSSETWCWLAMGGIPLMLVNMSAAHKDLMQTGRGICVEFRVTDLEKCCAAMLAAGGSKLASWEDERARYHLISDPMGNAVEIFQFVDAPA